MKLKELLGEAKIIGINGNSNEGKSNLIYYLIKELKKELKTGARVVSKYFTFPHWPHSKKEDNIYLYIK